MKTNKIFHISFLIVVAIVSQTGSVYTQVPMPTPGKPRTVSVPAVKEIKLKNGLTVAVVERSAMPLITVQMLVKNGSGAEPKERAGLANLTASMLTKGTKTRSATQIAEEMEFLGGSIFSFAGWQNSSAGMSITSDKFDASMAIFADVVRNPVFAQQELDLEKSQAVDGLTANLSQPGFLANYVASTYSYGEHPTGGTLASIASVTKADVTNFYSKHYRPDHSVLIFVGDISPEKAAAAAEKHFGDWPKPEGGWMTPVSTLSRSSSGTKPLVRRMLVVDMPNSGQASVNFVKPIGGIGRQAKQYYSASLLNSLLGGGYSSRLNQEIRIKRGLSYGAGSSFAWRPFRTNFGARAQTKDESAAEVAELMLAEIKRLGESVATDAELSPRKSVLTGGFGRNLETNQGIAGALADLYAFGIPTSELNAYMNNVNSVHNADVRSFASSNLLEGDLIIVGDYAKFKDDLAKRFPNMKVEVVKAADFQSTSPK
ncbi:hypothetical protein BH20ACI2_BH20ACI2_20000 [soil metagenome]